MLSRKRVQLSFPERDNEKIDKIQEILLQKKIDFKYSYPRTIIGSKYKYDRKHNIIYICSNNIKQARKWMIIMDKDYDSKIKYVFHPPNTYWPIKVIPPELNLLVKKKDVEKTNELLKTIFE